MQEFKFSTKGQAKTYGVFTVISAIIAIFVFSNWYGVNISSSVAFLIASIISFISLMMSIKKASKTFEEIIIDGNKVSFYFANKLKDNIIKDIDNISSIEKENHIEIIERHTNVFIGRGYKNRIEDKDKWDLLLKCLKNNNT